MAIEHSVAVRVIRWSGGQHPTLSSITRHMQKENLRPYVWENPPNYRYGVRSHGYSKVLYVVEGVVEFSFPETNTRVKLRAGDRIEIPTSICYGMIIGSTGGKCVEAALNAGR
jgi:hypothetical protein